ncbi:hypothetical protein LZC18_10070, partial [Campylobacter coli]|uniref:hypothetical protein n=1 Tax=Campylobacter coli TaxID=195 RepID=UPI001F08CDE9
TLPFGWAAAFTRFERNRSRPPAFGWWHALVRDWDLIGYFLPFGWPILSLARRWRRPPAGYRGLSKEARRGREGAEMWNLSERPL